MSARWPLGPASPFRQRQISISPGRVAHGEATSWKEIPPEYRATRGDSMVSMATLASVASMFDETIHYEAEGNKGGVSAWLARMVIRYNYYVLAVWAVVFVVSCFMAPGVLNVVVSSYDPEPYMPSGVALVEFDRLFPGLLDEKVDSVIFSLREGVHHWQGDPVIGKATDELAQFLNELRHGDAGLTFETRSWQQLEVAGEPGASYVSRDGRARLFQVVWIDVTESAAYEFLNTVRRLNETYWPHGVELASTGPHALTEAYQMQARHDVGAHAIMFLPLALLALHVHLCKVEQLLLPALCSLAALALAFAIGFVFASHMTVDANVPTLMAFLSISLCIDWSFFLLARVQEETNRGVQPLDALVTALARTGSNIALSGLLIVACSFTMLTMPAAVASNALGGSITVFASLTTCLSLLPACIAACPSWFGPRVSKTTPLENQPLASMELGIGEEPSGPGGDGSDGAGSGGEDWSLSRLNERMGVKVHDCQRAGWYMWAVLVTAFPCNVLVLICVCAAFTPATLALWSFVPAVDDNMCLPPEAPAVVARDRLHSEFAGKMQSKSLMYLLLEANEQCALGVRSNSYFQSTCDVAGRLLNLSAPERPLQASDLLSVSFYTPPDTEQLQCLPWRNDFASMEEVLAALKAHRLSAHLLLTGETLHMFSIPSDKFQRFHKLYKQLWSRCVNDGNRAALIVIQLPWDAQTWNGFRLVEDIRHMLASMQANSTLDDPYSCGQVRGWELSTTSIWYDFVTTAVQRLPIALGLACLLTTPFVAFSFGSVVAPVKLLLTVILPLTWVYGMAVWCYQDGALDFLGPSPVHSAGGLHWSVPCSSSMLLLALGLDYNIFYFGRAYEFRRAGLSDLEAIRQGLASTGPVITCAGVIFSIEFSGLFFSETPLNRQGGFAVVIGVLLDTFVVRSCLMPAVLSLGASWNWWPAAMPEVAGDALDTIMSPRGSLASRGVSLDDDCCSPNTGL